MTMLDRMRRHKGWLKWSLALVVLAFIIFYIPDFLQTDGSTGAPSDEIARIDRRSVTVAQFSRAYQAQVQAYRAAYGQNINEQLLRQLGFEQQILRQMIDQEAAMVEAQRLGISVGDGEVRQRILSMPEFQENGQFIGEQRYRQVLDMARPPVSPAEFEASLRRQMMIEKLRAVVTDWITVTDAEADDEYRRRNEKVKVQLVHVSAEAFRNRVTASDADVAAYYAAHKDKYRVGERRKIRYLLVDEDTLRASVSVPTREIERYYNNNIDQYSMPEQVHARHILLKTEGKDEAAVRAAAEKVLAAVTKGGDFAELAKQYSEDEQSKALGGDLDYFSRGQMVPEFEQAAFSLAPGGTSDLVKSSFGFHIIRVVDRREASTRSLDEVRGAITDQLKTERVQRQAATIAAEIAKTLKTPADLDKVAAARGLKVEETGFFTRDEPVLGLGGSPQVAAQVFELNEGEVTGAMPVSRGLAFAALAGRQDPAVPALETITDAVKEDVVKEKASQLATAQAESIGAALKAAADFAAAAKKAGLEAKSSELIARGTALPDVGFNPTVETAVFGLQAGEVSAPIATLDGTTIVKLIERRDVTPEELRSAREGIRNDMLNDRRNQFLSSYMTKAKEKMTIVMNPEVMQRVLGG